jgi:hypothetical protein
MINLHERLIQNKQTEVGNLISVASYKGEVIRLKHLKML